MHVAVAAYQGRFLGFGAASSSTVRPPRRPLHGQAFRQCSLPLAGDLTSCCPYYSENRKQIAMATYQIRKATPEDCEAIVELIKELAVYESMPDQVDMTPEKLREDAFCDQPFVNQLVAVDTKSNTVVGYSSFSYMYSTWKGRTVYLDDVYVTPAHRGSGLGTSLMQSVAKVAYEQRGCNRMNWIVLSWNERPKQLYARLGGENLTLKESWENITLFQEQLKNFATNYKVKIPDNTSVDIQL